MSDISKCRGNNCNAKEGCYRYTSPASYVQSYVHVEDSSKCQLFWPIYNNIYVKYDSMIDNIYLYADSTEYPERGIFLLGEYK